MTIEDYRSRPLTPSEEDLLPPEMARAIDLKEVRIVRRFHNPVAAAFRQTVVRGARIFWATAPAEARSVAERAHLAHELVHVWQYRFLKRSGLELLLDRRYRYALAPGTAFSDYGHEQQAAIVEDAVRLAAGEAPRWVRGAPAPLAQYAALIASCTACKSAWRPLRRRPRVARQKTGERHG